MSQQVGAAPLVQFAQKATAIVKAAGFDPKTIDLESFRRLAPIIFTRAYSAIYKEQLISDINEFSNREEQILNSQLVIDGLTAKTRNPALATISGIDIFQGNHRAVGILAGVLFAEGQRLWMEKMKSANQQSSPAKELTVETSASPGKPDSVAEDIMLNHEDEYQQLEIIKNKKDVPPHELEKLLHRIAYLEDRLKKKTKRRSRSKSRSKSPTSRRPESPNSRTSRERDRRSRSPADGRRHQYPYPPPRENNNNNYSNTSDISDDDEDGESLHHDNDSEPPRLKAKKKKKLTRPSSAPHRRRVREVSNRLYSAPLNKQVIDFAQYQQEANVPKQPKPPVANPLYTYDLKSGRRILVSQAEHERELREQAKKTMGNLNQITKDEDDFMGGGIDGKANQHMHSSKPAHPEYPCKRIEDAVEEWVKKNRQVAGVDKPVAEMPAPRLLNMYQHMQALDLVFSIEHCHNCEHHQITTRHKPLEYKKQADEFLRILAQAAMQAGLCVRVGVARFEADITCKSKTTDVNSRIGAFEVQIACKNERGELAMGMLHSKLFSGRWPSKSVLEKRFHTFMASKFPHLPSYVYSADGVTDFHLEIDADGQNYPIGRCTFTDTALADPLWSFTSFQSSSSSSIMWSFDTRSLQNMPKFSVQAMVLVNNVAYQPGCVEKYPLIGVVKRYSDEDNSSHSHGHSHKRHLYVQLKYHQSDTRVLESDCMPYDDHHPSLQKQLAGDAGKLPIDLEGLLMLARRENLLQWQVSDDEDRMVDGGKSMELSRRSFYHQLRKLAWQLIGKTSHQPLLHPILNRVIDAQLCYGERMMNKLLDMFGPQINTSQLEKYLPVDPASKTNKINNAPTVGKATASASNNGNNVSSSSNNTTGHVSNQSAGVSPRVSPRSLTTATAIAPGHGSSQDFAALAAAAAAAADTTTNTTTTTPSEKNNNNNNIDNNDINSNDNKNNSNSNEENTSTRPSRKSRRPTLSNKPSVQSLHDVDERFHKAITLPPNKASDKSSIEAFIADIEAIVAKTGSVSARNHPVIKLEEFIRLLYDYGLGSIADSAQDMRVLVCYLSPAEDEEGMGNELHVAKLAEWLRGQFLYPTEHTEQLVVSPRTSTVTTPSSSESPSKSKKPSTSPSSQSKALLQLPPASSTPLSSRRPTVNLASIAESKADKTEEEENEEGDEDEDEEKETAGVVSNEDKLENHHDPPSMEKPTDTASEPATPAPTPLVNPPTAAVSNNTPRDAKATENAADTKNGGTKSQGNTNTFSVGNSPRASTVTPTNFQNKDVVISGIVLQGVALQHAAYDSLYLMFEIENGVHLDATVCLSREKGSKHRTFNVSSADWTDIPFSAMQFREKHVYLSLVVADTAALQQYPNLPTVETTVLGVSLNSIAVPASIFAQPMFTIHATVQIPMLPNTVSSTTGAATSSSGVSTPSAVSVTSNSMAPSQEEGKVTITIHGLAREGKEARVSRIMSMKPVELLNLKFEPVALDDDYDDDSDFDSDAGSLHSKKSLSKHHKSKHEKSQEGLEFSNDESLNQTLFPQASYNNLLSPVKGLSANPSASTLPNAEEK